MNTNRISLERIDTENLTLQGQLKADNQLKELGRAEMRTLASAIGATRTAHHVVREDGAVYDGCLWAEEWTGTLNGIPVRFGWRESGMAAWSEAIGWITEQ